MRRPAFTQGFLLVAGREPIRPRLTALIQQGETGLRDFFQGLADVIRDVGGNAEFGVGLQHAGEACEVVKDVCARVPDGGLCDAWKKRRDETEVAWRFARRENVDRNRAEYERVARILSESDCGE